jgi:putative salt-induced outer membrane protein YdiY
MLLVLMAAVMLAAGPSLAAEESQGWQPDPPMPDDFDWVQMTSGEWLKGEIIAMYDETLEFDSDEFDDQSLDWGDIKEIRSANVCQVRFLDDTIATGKILLKGDTFRVMGEQTLERERSRVLSITPGEPKRRRNTWSGKVSAGLNLRTGNTEQTEFNAKANLVRRTPASRVNIDYLGNFSESDSISIADNQRVTANWDRFISNRFYWTPIYGELFRDPFQNINNRYTIGIGLGYTIKDTSKIDWDVTAGIAYQGTTFDDVLPDEDDTETSPALSIGTKYQHELTGWMDFHFDYNLFIVSEEAGTYTHHLLTGFEFDLTGDLDFDVDWVWDYIKDPRQNSDGDFPKQSDFRMMFSLGYSF